MLQITQIILKLSGAPKGSWREFLLTDLYTSLRWLIKHPIMLFGIMFPSFSWHPDRRTREKVRDTYDRKAGYSVKTRFYEDKEIWGVVGGEVKKISQIEHAEIYTKELSSVLSRYKFSSVLEVGAGELTTLYRIHEHLGDKAGYYAIDLSLNRILEGYKEFVLKRGFSVIVAQADATHLPFPDNSFDMVISSHCLEQIPMLYKKVVDEMVRVSRERIILFEPSFELGALPQKLKMLRNDYLRGMARYLRNKKDISVEENYMLRNRTNPLNPTACYNIAVKKTVTVEKPALAKADFVCPICHADLSPAGSNLHCTGCSRLFFVFRDIPLLDPVYAVSITGPIE